MHAAVFVGAGRALENQCVRDPSPGAGEVVLKVGFCGTDLHRTSGHGALQAKSGHILGHDFAGGVVTVGGGCQWLRVGDRVTAMPNVGCARYPACLRGEPKWCPERRSMQGGYGEFLAKGEAFCAQLPIRLSLEDGALAEPLAVGLHGVAVANMPIGARVLVVGAGPVGLAAVYWARRLGAGKIAVIATSSRRADLAEHLGATAFVTSKEDEVDAAKAALGGAPEVVFECVGTEGMITKCVKHVAPLGHIVVLGCCTVNDSFLPMAALFKEARVTFALLYSMREFHTCIDTLDSGSVEPRAMITDRVSLQQTPAMFEALRQRTSQCKVPIDPWSTSHAGNTSSF